jgi:MoaA/NifB/PqqE/SkfB family radical SAM enzyme
MTAATPATHPAGQPSKNLSIELTTRCNSPCRHCFARADLARESSLSPGDVRAICAEGFASGYRHLHLTGGEPLLWEGLSDLLAEAFAMGYESIFLNSNGMLLTRDAVRHLARFEDLALSVSLQGEAENHDRLRGSGAYRKTVRGIRRALDAGMDLTVFTVVGKRWLKNLAAWATGLFEDFAGINRLTLIQIIRVREDFIDLSQELLEPEDFLSLVRTVAGLNLFGFKTDVLNNPLVNVAAELLQMPWIPPSQPLCRPGRLMIRANRDMTLAHSTWERYGRYRPGMIDQVLASPVYRRAVAADEATCPACSFVSVCRSHGLIQPSGADWSLLPGKPYCQRVLTQTARG